MYNSNEIMGDLLANSLETAQFDGQWKDVGEGSDSAEGKYVNFLTISNLEQSVIDDVKRIRDHSLVPGYIPIYEYIYDEKSRRLIESN